MSEQNLKRRYFYLSFAIAFLALAVFAAGIVLSLNPPAQGQEGSDTPSQSVYIPSEQDSLTVLFIGTLNQESPAQTFMIIRFNPEAGQVPVTVLPPQTLLTNGEKQQTLYDVYRYGGAVQARQCLEQTLGISIDRYVQMTVDAFVEAADTIGSMEYDLAYDLDYTDETMSIKLAKGKQLLDGRQIADILRYPAFDGGQLTRAQVAADLTATMINQKVSVVLSPLLDNIFKKLINLVETDITYVDYDSRKQAAEFMANLSFSPANNLPLSGQLSEDGQTYILDEQTLQLIQNLY